jgi:uncharacterized protein HemY
MKNRCLVLLILLACLAAAGCGARQADRAALTPYDAHCLHNLQLGREYMGQGRYALAKEHFLLALAASDDPETRNLLSHELRSVEMMLKTQR